MLIKRKFEFFLTCTASGSRVNFYHSTALEPRFSVACSWGLVERCQETCPIWKHKKSCCNQA